MSRKTLLLSCVVLFGLLILALVVLFMLHTPLEPLDKTPPKIIWSQTYGGKREEEAYSFIQTSDGGYALAGRTTSFGSDYSCFWFVKVDSSGTMEWNKIYEGTGIPNADNRAYSVVETSDGGYALAGKIDIGLYNPDFWLIKTDANGNVEWNQTYGEPFVDVAYSVVETRDGGYAIAGRTRSFGAGDNDCWLVKVDSSGNLEWNQTYGGPHGGVAWCVQQTSDGGYAIAGETYTFAFQDDVPNYDFWLVKTESMYNEAEKNGGIPQFLPWIIVTVAIIVIGGVALLVYFAKIWKTT